MTELVKVNDDFVTASDVDVETQFKDHSTIRNLQAKYVGDRAVKKAVSDNISIKTEPKPTRIMCSFTSIQERNAHVTEASEIVSTDFLSNSRDILQINRAVERMSMAADLPNISPGSKRDIHRLEASDSTETKFSFEPDAVVKSHLHRVSGKSHEVEHANGIKDPVRQENIHQKIQSKYDGVPVPPPSLAASSMSTVDGSSDTADGSINIASIYSSTDCAHTDTGSQAQKSFDLNKHLVSNEAVGEGSSTVESIYDSESPQSNSGKETLIKAGCRGQVKEDNNPGRANRHPLDLYDSLERTGSCEIIEIASLDDETPPFTDCISNTWIHNGPFAILPGFSLPDKTEMCAHGLFRNEIENCISQKCDKDQHNLLSRELDRRDQNTFLSGQFSRNEQRILPSQEFDIKNQKSLPSEKFDENDQKTPRVEFFDETVRYNSEHSEKQFEKNTHPKYAKNKDERTHNLDQFDRQAETKVGCHYQLGIPEKSFARKDKTSDIGNQAKTQEDTFMFERQYSGKDHVIIRGKQFASKRQMTTTEPFVTKDQMIIREDQSNRNDHVITPTDQCARKEHANIYMEDLSSRQQLQAKHTPSNVVLSELQKKLRMAPSLSKGTPTLPKNAGHVSKNNESTKDTPYLTKKKAKVVHASYIKAHDSPVFSTKCKVVKSLKVKDTNAEVSHSARRVETKQEDYRVEDDSRSKDNSLGLSTLQEAENACGRMTLDRNSLRGDIDATILHTNEGAAVQLSTTSTRETLQKQGSLKKSSPGSKNITYEQPKGASLKTSKEIHRAKSPNSLANPKMGDNIKLKEDVVFDKTEISVDRFRDDTRHKVEKTTTKLIEDLESLLNSELDKYRNLGERRQRNKPKRQASSLQGQCLKRERTAEKLEGTEDDQKNTVKSRTNSISDVLQQSRHYKNIMPAIPWQQRSVSSLPNTNDNSFPISPNRRTSGITKKPTKLEEFLRRVEATATNAEPAPRGSKSLSRTSSLTYLTHSSEEENRLKTVLKRGYCISEKQSQQFKPRRDQTLENFQRMKKSTPLSSTITNITALPSPFSSVDSSILSANDRDAYTLFREKTNFDLNKHTLAENDPTQLSTTSLELQRETQIFLINDRDEKTTTEINTDKTTKFPFVLNLQNVSSKQVPTHNLGDRKGTYPIETNSAKTTVLLEAGHNSGTEVRYPVLSDESTQIATSTDPCGNSHLSNIRTSAYEIQNKSIREPSRQIAARSDELDSISYSSSSSSSIILSWVGSGDSIEDEDYFVNPISNISDPGIMKYQQDKRAHKSDDQIFRYQSHASVFSPPRRTSLKMNDLSPNKKISFGLSKVWAGAKNKIRDLVTSPRRRQRCTRTERVNGGQNPMLPTASEIISSRREEFRDTYVGDDISSFLSASIDFNKNRKGSAMPEPQSVEPLFLCSDRKSLTHIFMEGLYDHQRLKMYTSTPTCGKDGESTDSSESEMCSNQSIHKSEKKDYIQSTRNYQMSEDTAQKIMDDGNHGATQGLLAYEEFHFIDGISSHVQNHDAPSQVCTITETSELLDVQASCRKENNKGVFSKAKSAESERKPSRHPNATFVTCNIDTREYEYNKVADSENQLDKRVGDIRTKNYYRRRVHHSDKCIRTGAKRSVPSPSDNNPELFKKCLEQHLKVQLDRMNESTKRSILSENVSETSSKRAKYTKEDSFMKQRPKESRTDNFKSDSKRPKPRLTLEQHLSSRSDRTGYESDKQRTSIPQNKTDVAKSTSSQASVNWYRPQSLSSSTSVNNGHAASQPQSSSQADKAGPSHATGSDSQARSIQDQNARSTLRLSSHSSNHQTCPTVNIRPTALQQTPPASSGNQLERGQITSSYFRVRDRATTRINNSASTRRMEASRFGLGEASNTRTDEATGFRRDEMMVSRPSLNKSGSSRLDKTLHSRLDNHAVSNLDATISSSLGDSANPRGCEGTARLEVDTGARLVETGCIRLTDRHNTNVSMEPSIPMNLAFARPQHERNPHIIYPHDQETRDRITADSQHSRPRIQNEVTSTRVSEIVQMFEKKKEG